MNLITLHFLTESTHLKSLSGNWVWIRILTVFYPLKRFASMVTSELRMWLKHLMFCPSFFEFFLSGSCWGIFRFLCLVHCLSNQPVLLVDLLAALEEAVSLWRRCACTFLNSFINTLRWANCWVSESVTASIWRATSSDVTDTLDDASFTGSDTLLGLFPYKLSVWVLPSVSSVSIATDRFIYQRNGLRLVYEC